MPPGKKEKPQSFVSPSDIFFYKCPKKTAFWGCVFIFGLLRPCSQSQPGHQPLPFFIVLLNWWPVWLIYIPGDCLLQIPNRQRPFVSIFRTHLMCYLFWKILNWNNSALCKVPSSASGPRTAEVQK